MAHASAPRCCNTHRITKAYPRTRLLTEHISLRRSFWLIRHADDRASRRLTLLAEALAAGLRAEVARLEGLLTAGGDGPT